MSGAEESLPTPLAYVFSATNGSLLLYLYLFYYLLKGLTLATRCYLLRKDYFTIHYLFLITALHESPAKNTEDFAFPCLSFNRKMLRRNELTPFDGGVQE